MHRINLVARMPCPHTLCFSTGVGNLRPARTIMSRIRIFVSQDKTKLHDKQTCRQSPSIRDLVFTPYFPLEDKSKILR